MNKYRVSFEQRLEEVERLITTPRTIQETAVWGLEQLLAKETKPTVRTQLENNKSLLENISERSLKNEFNTIYESSCILAVSALETTLRTIFIDQLNAHPSKVPQKDKIKIPLELLRENKLASR